MTTTLVSQAMFLGRGPAQRADGWLLVHDGRIADLGWGADAPPADQTLSAEGLTLAPGLVDLHAHGALGVDTMDAQPKGLRQMARFYASHGVTSFLATTMTAPTEQILAALQAIAQVRAQGTGGAELLGAHVEGPYLDVERRGCQDAAQIRPAEPQEYRPLLATGEVRLLTVAPEVPQNTALLREACAQGVALAIGHSRADYETVQRAVAWGASQVTHLFNGMDPLHHRAPGLVGAALTLDALSCQLIADNIHIHPAVMALAVRAKGPERILLVTDAMAATGMADGAYQLGNIAVTVRAGVSRTPDGALAGSTLTLERAVINLRAATGLPLAQVWAMASAQPARSVGLHQKGTLAVGYDADLVLMDAELRIRLTMVGGEVVYQA